MQNKAFRPSWPAPETPIVLEERPVSFAGNAFVVLVVLLILAAGITAGIGLYDLLASACVFGCPA